MTPGIRQCSMQEYLAMKPEEREEFTEAAREEQREIWGRDYEPETSAERAGLQARAERVANIIAWSER